jgi:hypothetical protein
VSRSRFWEPSASDNALFTGVRGIGILRTSPFGDSQKFPSSVMHSPSPVQQIILCRVSRVHSSAHIRYLSGPG